LGEGWGEGDNTSQPKKLLTSTSFKKSLGISIFQPVKLITHVVM
jgi:hypothetical protein